METTAYTVLGIARDATEEQISAAYKARAREHHPDHGGDAAKMARVNKAWEKLGNPEARAAYDRRLLELERGAQRPEAAEGVSSAGGSLVDRIKAAGASGLDFGDLMAEVGLSAGMLDGPGGERVRAAAKKGERIGQDWADLIGLVRGHQR